MTQVEKQILEYFSELSESQQRDVLRFVEGLRKRPPTGIKPDDLIRRAVEVQFPAEDLEEMTEAIEEGCEQIDENGW